MKKLLIAAVLLAASTSAQACNLSMEKAGDRRLHIIIKCEQDPHMGFDRYYRVQNKPLDAGCLFHIEEVNRVDDTTYLVYGRNDSGCKPPKQWSAWYHFDEPENTLRIRDVEGS